MKTKKKILLSLIAAMVIMAIGTVAVYAAGELQVKNTYAQFKSQLTWDVKEMPESLGKAEIIFDIVANDTVIGKATIPAKDKSNWACESGFDGTLAYEFDADGEPVFYPADLVFSKVRMATGPEKTEDLSEGYRVITKIEKVSKKDPRDRKVELNGKEYDVDLPDFNIETVITDKGEPVVGEVKWDNIPEAERPQKAVVKVMSGGKEIASQEVNAAGNWKYNIEIPIIEKYELVVEVPGFSVVQDGSNLIVSKAVAAPEKEKAPKTADGADVAMWIMVAGIALAGLATAKKNKVNN